MPISLACHVQYIHTVRTCTYIQNTYGYRRNTHTHTHSLQRKNKNKNSVHVLCMCACEIYNIWCGYICIFACIYFSFQVDVTFFFYVCLLSLLNLLSYQLCSLWYCLTYAVARQKNCSIVLQTEFRNIQLLKRQFYEVTSSPSKNVLPLPSLLQS